MSSRTSLAASTLAGESVDGVSALSREMTLCRGQRARRRSETDDQDALDGVHRQPALARGLELVVRVRAGLVQDRDAKLALVGALVVDWASARIVSALQQRSARSATWASAARRSEVRRS